MVSPRSRFLGLLAVLALFLSGCTEGATSATDAAPGEGGQLGSLDVSDVSDLVEQVRPGVVAVTQAQVQRDFFGRTREVPAGAGTGVVIDDEGGILTNHHVVQGADDLVVTTSDGTNHDGELAAAAPRRDLALIEASSTEGLEPLPLGNAADLAVGDPVLAIGNALGLDAADLTVSAGIVSAKGRSLSIDQGRLLSGLIQTDAAINPGNSGGPLLNINGEVMGINTAIAGSAQNIGFAIAIDGAQQVIERLRSGEGQPYLGVALVDNAPAIAFRFELSTETGAVVTEVDPQGARGSGRHREAGCDHLHRRDGGGQRRRDTGRSVRDRP